MEKTLRTKIGSSIYLILAVLFATCVTIQVLLAGAATFVHVENWLRHSTFVHLFGMNVPVLMLIFAFVGKMPRWAYLNVVGLLVSIFAMYFTANFTAKEPWVAAAHPVIAMVLFVLSIWIVTKSGRFVIGKNKIEKGEK